MDIILCINKTQILHALLKLHCCILQKKKKKKKGAKNCTEDVLNKDTAYSQ